MSHRPGLIESLLSMANSHPNNSVSGLLVVAPVYNEEKLVDRFLDRIAELGKQTQLLGIVLVDDGSIDHTVMRIEKRASDFFVPIRLVRLSRNFGHQNACVAGVGVAVEWGADLNAGWIGLIDADLQDNPLDFVALLNEGRGHDIVYAVRHKRDDGLVMKVLAPAFYRMLSATSDNPIPANAGTFSVMRVPAARLIYEMSDNDPYFPGLRAWVGLRQYGVPLSRAARAEGKSRLGLFRLVLLSLRAFIQYSNLPLNALLFSGLAIFSISVITSLVLIVMRLAGLITIPGVTTIVVLELFIIGIQFMLFGLIAHMISRVKANTSRQKTWLVMTDKVLN